ncbi:MAG: lipid-A-disaccharide synthase [Defluviicoccus sp.]|nr:lipid-A-disaccharide synthase [Defluviicoccus sp.]
MEPLEPSFFFIAGEPSGDEIGGRLIAALREATGGEMRMAGIGGEAMSAEGLESLFPIEELSVMGLVEVVPRAPGIMRRMSQTARAIRRLAPDAVVTIDAPAFANGVWRRLGEVDAALIHYVAPTVWAWRAGRARKLARRIDHLLALFPFEPPHFAAEGLDCTFVGHPVLETGIATDDGASFRARHGISAGPVIGLLPGSRRGEIRRLMPVFADATRRIAQAVPAIRAVIPAVPAHAALIREAAAELPVPVTVTAERGERHAAMAACDAAIAASGTVSLDLALAGVPMAIAYKLNPLTATILRRMIRVRYATIVNLVLDRPAIPEFLQESCTGAALAEAALLLLRDEGARCTQIEATASAIAALRPDGERPSARAATAILDVLRHRTDTRIEQGAVT